jgi:uncharacterized protein (TIGR00369 family)
MNTGKELIASPYLKLLGVIIDEAEYPRSRLLLGWKDNLVNPMGTLHGGVIASLVDAAMGCALLSSEEVKGIATTELKVNYFRAVTSGIVKVEGEVIHRQGSVAFGQAFLYCEKELIAVGSATYRLY